MRQCVRGAPVPCARQLQHLPSRSVSAARIACTERQAHVAQPSVRRPARPHSEVNNVVPLELPHRCTHHDSENESASSKPALVAVSPSSGPAANARRAPAAAQSVLGAIALLCGSTVGAGILALPSVTEPAGFFPSCTALLVVWGLLTLEALLIAEVNITIRERRVREGSMDPGSMVTLQQMAQEALGLPASVVMQAVYLFLAYSLLTAYISKAGDLLHPFGVGREAAEAAFSASLGAVLCGGGARVADGLNRAMTAALLVLFGIILAVGASHADWGTLPATVSWTAVPATIPIIFLSLVYHDLVPVICMNLHGNRRKVAATVVFGSMVPLAMFVAFLAVALALVGDPVGIHGGDPMEAIMRSEAVVMGPCVAGFSLLAILTSFIGTYLGLSSTLRSEVIRISHAWRPGSRVEDSSAHWLPAVSTAESQPSTAALGSGEPAVAAATQWGILLAAVGPPLAFSLNNPGGFLEMLQVAGGYGMTALYGILPPLMALRMRRVPCSLQRVRRAMVPGGPALLRGLSFTAAGIEAARLAMDLHLDLFGLATQQATSTVTQLVAGPVAPL